MSEMKPVARVDGRWSDGRAMVRTLDAGANMQLGTELYTDDQLAEAVAERDLLIRDLRKELNERRYGRSVAK